MASIYKRKNNNGTAVWRVVIRIKGYPTVCNHFERKQEADDWAKETERRIKLGGFNKFNYRISIPSLRWTARLSQTPFICSEKERTRALGALFRSFGS